MIMDNVVDLNLFIANEWSPAVTGQTFDIDNPATGEVMGGSAGRPCGCHRRTGTSQSGFSSLV